MVKTVWASLVLLSAVNAWSGVKDIIPTPQEAKAENITLQITDENKKLKAAVVLGKQPSLQSVIAAEYITKECRKKANDDKLSIEVINYEPSKLDSLKGKNLIVIGTPDENTFLQEIMNASREQFKVDKNSPGPQGYAIKFINSDGRVIACLAGSDPQGALYATMSFLFLIENGKDGIHAAGASIRDWPDFNIRWLGGGISSEENIDQQLRYKVNMTSCLRIDDPKDLKKINEKSIRLCEYAKTRGMKPIVITHTNWDFNYPKCMWHKGRFVYGYCFSNEKLNNDRVKRIKEVLNTLKPSAFYIHGIDYAAGGLNGMTLDSWKLRCEDCKKKYPADEMISMQGNAKAWIDHINMLYKAVREESAGKDVMLYFVIPPYPLISHSEEQIAEIAKFWNMISSNVPADVRICAREVSQGATEMLSSGMAGKQPVLMYLISGTHENFSACAIDGNLIRNFYRKERGNIDFFGAIDCGTKPDGIVMADYAWNCHQPGESILAKQIDIYNYFKKAEWPENWMKNDYIRDVAVQKACKDLYGNAASEMFEFFKINPRVFQFDSCLEAIRARGKNTFMNKLNTTGKSSFYELAFEKYPNEKERFQKAYPAIKKAWAKIKDDKTIPAVIKANIVEWLYYCSLGNIGAEILEDLSKAWYYQLNGENDKAKDSVEKATGLFEKLKNFKEDAISSEEKTSYLSRYSSFEKSFIQNISEALTKIKVNVKHLGEASLLAISAEKNIMMNDFTAAGNEIKKAAGILNTKQEFSDKTEEKEFKDGSNKLLAKVNDLNSFLNWKKSRVAKTGEKAITEIKAGIFDAEKKDGKSFGKTGIMDALKCEKHIKPEYVSVLSSDELRKFNVIIIPSVNAPGNIDKSWRDNLKKYVEAGGGIIFSHTSCGREPYTVYQFGPSLFPDIVKGVKGRSEITELTIKKKHSVTDDFAVGEKYKTAYYDHLKLIPGSNGTVLVEDPDPLNETLIGLDAATGDNKSDAVVVAGKSGKGKVVYLGNMPGYKGKGTTAEEAVPRMGEYQILLNAIKWCSDKFSE